MNQRRHIGAKVSMAVLAVFLTGAFCAHAERIIDTDWDAGLDGWTAVGEAVVTNTSGYLQIIFPEQSVPEHSAETLTEDMLPGYRPNYVSFRFRAPTLHPSVLRVHLLSSSGRSWYKNFTVSATNEWLRLSSLVTFESGWVDGPSSDSAEFDADMNSVTKVSLYVVRDGSEKAHEFHVDDFELDGVAVGNPHPDDNDDDGMLDTWELANGFDSGDPADSQEDADGDGLDNYDEYVAGTDPRNAASLLALSMPKDLNLGTEEYVTIAWPSASGRVYQVWKSTNLLAGFYLLRGGIAATLPVNFYSDSTVGDPASVFYKVEVE